MTDSEAFALFYLHHNDKMIIYFPVVKYRYHESYAVELGVDASDTLGPTISAAFSR